MQAPYASSVLYYIARIQKGEMETSAASAPARPRPGRLQALLRVVLVSSNHALLLGTGRAATSGVLFDLWWGFEIWGWGVVDSLQGSGR